MNLVDLDNKMLTSIEHLEKELQTIRTSRANPTMLENIYIDAYGSKTPLNQLGNISSPDSSMLTIQVWDVSLLKNIESSILESNLGINPQVDGALIKTVSGVDTILWENIGPVFFAISLFDGPSGSDTINTSTTAESVQTVPSANKVDVRFRSVDLAQNVSIMKKVILGVNETVSLKFKTKTLGDPSLLKKAQFFLQELDM